MTEKKCNRCGRKMARKYNDMFQCSCGNIWIKDKGYFQRVPGMEFKRLVRQIGNQEEYFTKVYVNGTEMQTLAEKARKRYEGKVSDAAYNRRSGRIVRGGVYFVSGHMNEGSEIYSGRPAVVVSDASQNKAGTVVTIVYLTSKEKAECATHVPVPSAGPQSLALCEQVTTVDTRKVGTFYCMTTPDEMAAIKRGLVMHLGMLHVFEHNPSTEGPERYIAQLETKVSALEAQLAEEVEFRNKLLRNKERDKKSTG